MKNYFERSSSAPYLQTLPSNDRVRFGNEDAEVDKGVHDGEADAAAGSMLRKVSSFSLLGVGSPNLRSPARKSRQRSEQQEQATQKEDSEQKEDENVVPTWRLKDRMRTVGVGLVMALNVGTDPPDVTKPHPCAKLQCWIDPGKFSRAKAKETIGERLEAQYSNWQQQRARPLKYRRALDPTVEDVRALCLWLRRQARTERILLHYNGHGVPRPTPNGEIWVFDRNHTQYIPLSVTDLRQWMGKPSIVVLDCSSAGVLMPFLTASLDGATSDGTPPSTPPRRVSPLSPQILWTDDMDMDAAAAQWVRDTIVLCPTSDQEWLPMLPDYPADIFTSCLTTPIQMALRWFVRRNPQSVGGLSPEVVDAIPGKANDRKTPLGELNWIFTAVTDSIAWNVLPKPLFSRLFRQDLLVASMFRNFLLADRILRSLNCTPQSYPPLPPGVCDHPLWLAWDLACETCLHGLIRDGILGNHVLTPIVPKPPTEVRSPVTSPLTVGDGSPLPEQRPITNPAVAKGVMPSVSSPFFSEQLTAFEVWLEFATIHKKTLSSSRARKMDSYESPEQLPVVLQVLLSQAHRVRALELLRRFLELGDWATNLALSLGIFPYVMKLLQSPEYKQVLVGIWAKILAFDRSCQVDLVKDGSLPHFIRHLSWGLNDANTETPRPSSDAAEQRTMAAFIIALTCFGYPRGQMECLRQNLQGTCCGLLSSVDFTDNGEVASGKANFPPLFRLWLCICLGNLVKDNNAAQSESYGSGVHLSLFARLNDDDPDVRAGVCYALGCLLGSSPGQRNKGDEDEEAAKSQPSSAGMRRMQPQGFLNPSGGAMQQPMVVPRLLTTTGQAINPSATGTMHPTFAPPNVAGAQVLPWHTQPLRAGMMPQPIHVSQLTIPPSPYTPAMMPNHPNPAGVLPQPGYPYVAQGQPQLLTPQYNRDQNDPQQQAPSVFEDHNRLTLDVTVMECLVQAAEDASPLVRYEVIMSLACAVEKYLPAFSSVAEKLPSSPKPSKSKSADVDDAHHSSDIGDTGESDVRPGVIHLPPGVDHVLAEKFASVWHALRSLQRNDLHPAVSTGANKVVSVVHEYILTLKMEHSHLPENDDQNDSSPNSGIERDPRKRSASMGRNKSDAALANQDHGAAATETPTTPNDAIPKASLRRISSEYMSKWRPGLDVSPQIHARKEGPLVPPSAGQNQFKIEYVLPKSMFYEWKRDDFKQKGYNVSSFGEEEVDALSPEGAIHAYRERRGAQMRSLSEGLAERYAGLAPKPPKPTRGIYDDDLGFDDAAAEAAEEEAMSRKNELRFRQSALLMSDEVASSILRFHPYEEALVVGDGADGISVWDLKNSKRAKHFGNGNPKNSRITSASWINEMSSSIFLVASDDGSVRFWDGLMEDDGQISKKEPSLSSAFFAAPDLVAGERGSGLITEWQQYSGRLVAGGNSKWIRCWDFNAEQCVTTLETKTDACITTLTTAWEHNHFGGSNGVGPDIVVAGCSNGCLKVFDIRASPQAAELSTSPRNRMRRRDRFMNYTEHNSWIVNTAFTAYGGRPEIVSGSFAGDIKVWDLRRSTSIKTVEAQRSRMTTLSTHAKIPMVATGSHAQFIKLLTLDGDTLQVIRYHEKKSGNRIGPVSCLEFHPHKPLLASATTDKTVSIYSPRSYAE